MRKIVLVVFLALLIAVSSLGIALARPVLAQVETQVQVLIGFAKAPGPDEQALIHRVGGNTKYTYRLIPVIAAEVPERAIPGLLRNPNVTHIERDGLAYAVDDALPWGVDRIDAEVVHNRNNKGTGVKVAVIDTGIDKDHPDLAANVKGGVNLVLQWLGLNVDPNAWDDDNGHGSHVAGIIAAADNGIGVIGVAPEAWLYGIKVLDKNGQGYWSDIIAGIDWAVDPNGDGDRSDRMDVINMSLGATTAPEDLGRACNEAYLAGIVVVAAAGNNGDSNPDDDVIWPAKYGSVIAVAATDSNDTRASWSSDGPEVELAAPGVSVYSTYKNGGYATMSGTSMASPHVAGTAALVIAWGGLTDLSYDGDINNLDVRIKLEQTARNLGTPGLDPWYGYGLVDAAAASASSTPDGEPPTISLATGNTLSTTGESVAISATITDNVGVVGASVTYTPIGGTETTVPMNKGAANIWDASVPVAPDKAGTITYYIAARDAGGNTATDPDIGSYGITVTDNDKPVAEAGLDKSVLVGATVYFDGSGSSDNIGVTRYSWDFDAGDGISVDANAITASHVYAAAGTYTVTLIVNDAAGNGPVSDTLKVTVTTGTAPPTITGVDPDQGNRGQTLNVAISGTSLTTVTGVNFGAGIGVNHITVYSSTQITVNITISPSAKTGWRNISVTAPSGTSTLRRGFFVVK